ncbi:MAG: hypothetical protein K2F77_07480 [Muribaculaceae bacterium]|nr:hypothetical protein [Muribaculaceae bacterium]
MRITNILAGAALIAIAGACNRHADIAGMWTSTPVRVGDDIAMASTATSVLTIDFNAQKGRNSGTVMLAATIDATQPVEAGTLAGFAEPYEVSVAATATISGKWSYEDNDDDDILIFLDNNTLQVNIDPNGVTYSQNLLTGAQQPMVDSLTTATIDRWRSAVRNAASKQFFQFTKLDDVKVHNDILSFEVGKRDLTFHRSSIE